ncbi:mediator of RNA polymerase II transcription subunit 13-like isoform X2 [Pomacea canaliculata]|uniref:mediator of RNA polymerase II transcription subunit 13-like isoform X2 n=1 Tax=Pomacea canaliculata TaxID=400727 RepID=UPI000D727DD4|nr:mediator of RNA polymerase II transcription subunit 13-like isoform X2 [Pomacea canaliculata]
MSHPNPTGNGCTLEDCYTNLFVLTDICGIKWRRLTVDSAPVDQLDDPVLVAYSRCIQNDILCVWRRVIRNVEQRVNPPDQLSCSKELWIFWYGDQPSILDSLLSSDLGLKEVEHGTWDRDKDSGLTYECRTLLFKALHNLIERCLLSKNFIRLGKWFVMPHENSTASDRTCYLSFCFHFFLHGESQVCASIEVKKHPPVWRITNQHLCLVQDSQVPFQVILAPYGLNGTLTGQAYRDMDPNSRRVYQEWVQYYPLEMDDAKEFDPNRLPNLVEVLVAGVRMRYPSAYVLICESEDGSGRGSSTNATTDNLAPRCQGLNPSGQLSPPHSPGPGLAEASVKPGNFGLEDGRAARSDANHALGHLIIERSAQDATLSAGTSVPVKRSQEPGTEDNSIVGVWNFSDPSTKVTCNCVKHRKMKSVVQGKSASGGKHGKSEKPEKLERQQSRHGRNTVPFHRRQHMVEDMLQFDMERVLNHVPPNPAFCPTGSTTIPPHGGSTPVPEGPIDTPNSAPSPLDEPQPPALPSTDPTMPTLSPHPPSKFSNSGGASASGSVNPGTGTVNGTACSGGGGVGSGASGGINGQASGGSSSGPGGGNCAGNVANGVTLGITGGEKDFATRNGLTNGSVGPLGDPQSVLPNGSFSSSSEFFPKMEDTSAGGGTTPSQPKAAAGGGVTNSVGVSGASVLPDSQSPWSVMDSAKSELVSNWVQLQQKSVESVLKRPMLPTYDSDEEGNLATDALYDYETVQAWVHFPLKKSRYESVNDSFLPSASTSGLEPISPAPSHSQRATPLPRSPSPDPYEFSEEASVNPATMTARARPSRDDLSRPSPRADDETAHPGEFGQEDVVNDIGQMESPLPSGGNLTREKDLEVIGAEKDLLRIFESSSSGDDDDDGGGLDIKTNDELKTNIKPPNETIAASELARMFPTPPSLETNKIHSPPETATEAPMEVVATEGPSIKVEMHHPVTLDDSSKFDVFVPPKHVNYVSAPKYSQLPRSLLSAPVQVPVLDYKPSWHFAMPAMENSHPPRTTYLNVPSVDALNSRPMPSPALYSSTQQTRTPRTPMSYELQSPASTPSSYLNKTLNSIDNAGTNSQLPEVHSLLVNILLSDSILNLFRDYNFESCNICVCNMDIRGSDIGLYLPETGSSSESSYKCTCGFSAVVNRRFAYNAGLFYEDEVDITGIRDDRYERRKPLLHLVSDGKTMDDIEDVTPEVLHLLMGQFALAFPTSAASSHLASLNISAAMTVTGTVLERLQLRDGNDTVYTILDLARQALDNCYPHKLEDPCMRSTCLHKWPYLRGCHGLPHNSQDIVQCLKALQPLLQDAIQYKRITRLWEHTYKLQGPLSWKDFHQLSGRGSVESSEPQPIPHFLVTHDRDWLSVSPYSIRFWDKQYLEPFGRPRDIIYIVVAPENEFLLQHVRSFFKELSTVYELCRLGRHVPIKPLRDGILRIGRNAAQKVLHESVDDWFNLLGDTPVAAKLKMYAQVCKHLLAPILQQQTLDRSAFDTGNTASHKAQFKTPEPAAAHPATPDPSHSPATGISSQGGSEENKGEGSQAEGPTASREAMNEPDIDDGSTMPAIVVYFIDPFSYGQDWADLQRLAMIGLLRCYHQMVLPPHLQNNIFLQVVPMKAILDHRESSAQSQSLKSLAFSVFTSCRWNLTHAIMGRSLTGFGPAASAEQFLKNKVSESQSRPFRLYSPPYILAPMKNQQAQLSECCGDHTEKSNVLFCGYCLSHDQRSLLAVCTDSRGELLDTCVINIHIPNRNQRKKASARKHGLSKLWDYILGVISLTTRPTRLVIGRFGRIGHGELKGWSGLLGKKNLQAASRRIREMCGQCSINAEYPCVRSACVVSLEMNPSFQVMADAIKQEEKQSSNCPLQTPRDASVTHILVFPTSATAQVNANPLQPGDPNPMDTYDPLDIDDVFGDGDLGQDVLSGMESDLVIDIFDPDQFDPQAGSPPVQDRTRVCSRTNEPSMIPNGQLASDPQDDVNLLQQPLAMGYYISTAPTGPLPPWFWSACPENQHVNPTCFKAALHINMSSRAWQDELDHSPNNPNRSNHPLDSHLTCDVLRFVLENYNALSWLTYDPVTNDRRSCLPVHKAVLMQMYHALQTYI